MSRFDRLFLSKRLLKRDEVEPGYSFRARALIGTCISASVLLTIPLVWDIIAYGVHAPRVKVLLLTQLFFLIPPLVLRFYSNLPLAAWMMNIGTVLSILYWTVEEGGIHGTALLYFALVPPFAAFFGNRRTALIVTVSLILGVSLIAGHEYLYGSLPLPLVDPTVDLVARLVDVVVTTVFSFVFSMIVHGYTQRQLGAYRTAHEQLKAQNALIAENGRMKLMGSIAAGIAHEINNPLTIILGNTHVLRKKVTNSAEREAIEPIIKKIEEGIDRITRITAGMSALARGGNSVEAQEILSPKVVLKETLDFYSARLQSSGIRLELQDTVSDTVEVLLGRLPFSQVLMNLLNNAIYALRSTQTPIIRIVSREAGDHWVLRVEDNGPGIERAHENQIFEPFFTTKPPGEGTGLGLSLCKRLIHEEQGTLEYRREQGWTIFEIRIPCHLESNHGKSSV